MKLLNLNIRSLKTSRLLLENYVETNGIDLITLSETWHNSETLNFKNWNTEGLFKNREDGSPYGGVAILPNPKIKIVPRPDLSTKTDNEICWAQIEHNNIPVTIASIYIPSNRNDKFWDCLENIKHVISKVPNSPIIISGDFNARSFAWEN